MSKIALISGITGQDGSFLAELLLEKGYTVHGIVRRSSSFNTGRINHIYQDPHESHLRLSLHYGDLSDSGNLRRLVERIKPDEVYNFGAQSHVMVSFEEPEHSVDIDALGTLRFLEAIRDYRERSGHQVRFYQASSSEMFGSAPPPQNEATPFHPRSPYGCAKVYAFWQTVNYRESYGLFACNGILFNHESERRGETFVTRKITRAATRIKLGLQEKLYLGNLESKRDWGFAGDYVEAAWRMLQANEPGDYVVATGKAHTVCEFAEKAFGRVGLDYLEYVEIDSRYFRPAEVDFLEGDASHIARELGWTPTLSFDGLIDRMIDGDIKLAQQEKVLSDYARANGSANGQKNG